jgi:hypothetical protein
MLSVLERGHAVIDKACGTAPHRDVTAFEMQATHRIGTAFAAPQEYGRQAERDGDDRSPAILLVTVLMKTEFGTWDVAVDEASVGIVVREPGLGSGTYGDIEECRGAQVPPSCTCTPKAATASASSNKESPPTTGSNVSANGSISGGYSRNRPH